MLYIVTLTVVIVVKKKKNIICCISHFKHLLGMEWSIYMFYFWNTHLMSMRFLGVKMLTYYYINIICAVFLAVYFVILL